MLIPATAPPWEFGTEQIQQPVNASDALNLIEIPLTPFAVQVQNQPIPAAFCLLNARSINNKSSIIKDFVVDHNVDILALTETWTRPDNSDQRIINDLCPNGYLFRHVPRKTKGGGVALLYKKNFNIKDTTTTKSYKSFELADYTMYYSSRKIRTIVIYRPPPSTSNSLTHNMFFDEFSQFLESVTTTIEPVLICGDFNFHLDVPEDRTAQCFLDLLDNFNFQQHVNEGTHKSGHTLDLIITRSESNLVSNIHIVDPVISDHFAVHCALSISKPSYPRREISYRKITKIDREKFQKDIENSPLTNFAHIDNVKELSDLYEDTLTTLLNQHAPIKCRTITLRPAAPWYTDDIKAEKTKRRRLERQWRKSRLTVHRQLYVDQCKLVNSLICESKLKFYSSVIEQNSSNQSVLFSTVDKLLNLSGPRKLPTHSDAADLANTFVEFFTQKVLDIRNELGLPVNDIENDPDVYIDYSNTNPQPALDSFMPTSTAELSKLLGKMYTKSCILDPIPGKIMKDCGDTLLPIIEMIVNLSFAEGVVPKNFKEAAVTPKLKKPSLDSEILQNFRPISNLRLISKSAEKVVAARLHSHLNDNNFHEPFQSAYKQGHSTETALVRVQNDILRSIDNHKCVILLLLDLSAAFDTVDHSILLSRLKHSFRITGKALDWFISYLKDRSQFVSIDDKRSCAQDLPFGVPQGSILGPLLYLLYTSPLSDVIKKHNMDYHFYADDTQVYMSFRPSDASSTDIDLMKQKVESCVHAIQSWMTNNRLKLNNDKTELLILKAQHRPPLPLNSIYACGELVTPSESAKNLGVWFDSSLSMRKQVNYTCKTAFYHLRNLATIKKFLSPEHFEILIHAFITSRLDFCNSLLSGLPQQLLKKLQHVQNAAARLLTYTRKSEHITPVLKHLHWLPVPARIDFKILVLVFKVYHGLAPSYLCELIHKYSPGRSLRSATKNQLIVPRYNLKTYGLRAFSVAGPKLWNSLPSDIRSIDCLTTFKAKVKTLLFKLAYE